MVSLATLGGGCFWCFEAIYQQVNGIEKVVSGYAGGISSNPTYDQVHNDKTGHAEVVQLTFEPTIISYSEILEIFYSFHDPTTPNQQGNDVGPEYRSIILYHDDEQRKIAEEVTTRFAKNIWNNPIVTEIKPLDIFWPAEDYHQNFFRNNPEQGYCQVIINPKLQKLRQKYASKLKPA